MSLSDFFQAMPQNYDIRSEYRSNYREWDTAIREDEIEDFSSLLDLYGALDNLVEEDEKGKLSNSDSENLPLLSTNQFEKKVLRMQEIEAYALKRLIVKSIYGNLCIWNGRNYAQVSPDTFTKEVRKILPMDMQDKLPNYSVFNETYRFMKANGELTDVFSEECIEKTKKLISFKNCVFDAEKGKTLEHNADYPILFSVDAEYDPYDKDTSVMDELIDTASGNDFATKKLFYEVLGCILSQNMTLKKFFVFGTAPDSGKSKVGEFIGRLIGDENTSTIELQNLSKRFSSGTLCLKALNYNMDLPASAISVEAAQQLKQWTGDPRTSSEMKYVQGETVYHHCKFLFATNHPIRLKYDDDAFYNRLVLVPFVKSVPEEDKDYELGKKLWNSRNAIVTKAAKAYKKLCERNFVFTQSTLAYDMINSWRNRPANYRLREFIEKKCAIQTEDQTIFTPTEELFRAYQKFWLSRGYEVLDDEKNTFSRQLHEETRLVAKKKRLQGYASPVNGYCGILLITEDDSSVYGEDSSL